MLNIGLTKLQLDDAVGGEEITLDGEAGSKEDNTAKEVRKSLLTTLRNKFVEEPKSALDGIKEEGSDGVKKEEGDGNDGSAGMDVVETPVKIARGAGKKDEQA
jgi:SWI/SNF-related matrix-associated actin-dependent regulator 1 of chromatin subfamily A